MHVRKSDKNKNNNETKKTFENFAGFLKNGTNRSNKCARRYRVLGIMDSEYVCIYRSNFFNTLLQGVHSFFFLALLPMQ